MTPEPPNAPQSEDMQRAAALMRAGKDREAREAMLRAADSGDTRACLVAGLWEIVGYGGPVAAGAATAHLKRADDSGERSAAFLLSTLAVSGAPDARNWSASLGYLLRAGERGDPRALSALALLATRDEDTQAIIFENAAHAGDPLAQFFHGRRLISRGGAEKEAGLIWLNVAAAAGEPCSQAFLRREGAAPSTARPTAVPAPPINWNAVADSLDWPHARAVGSVSIRHESPSIGAIPNFLYTDECLFLMSRGAPLLAPARAGGASGLAAAAKVRTNDAMKYGLVESDPAIQSIHARIAAALGEPIENAEPPALLRYKPGQQYAPHFDWIDPADSGKAENVATWGQRIKTLIVYLNDEYDAGETAFPRLDAAFRGRAGDALFWRNVDRDGGVDQKTLHAGISPKDGEKWVLSVWMRDRSQAENFS